MLDLSSIFSLPIPVIGNMFNAQVSELSFFKKEQKIDNINNTVNLFVQFRPTTPTQTKNLNTDETSSKRISEPHLQVPQQLPQATMETEGNNPMQLVEPEKSQDMTNLAPCFVRTTLVFEDSRVQDFEALNLGKTRLFILKECPIPVPLQKYPRMDFLNICRGTHSATFKEQGVWKVSSKMRRYSKLLEMHIEDAKYRINIGPNRPISQVRAVRNPGWYSATLYNAPVGKEILILDQNYLFSKQIFEGVFVIAVRSHPDDNTTYLREIVLVGMLKQGEEQSDDINTKP